MASAGKRTTTILHDVLFHDANPADYLTGRQSLLGRLARDQARWTHSLEAPGAGDFIIEVWTGMDGQERQFVLTRSFVAIHHRILESVIQDLAQIDQHAGSAPDRIAINQRSAANEITTLPEGHDLPD
jgi:hypothetical protein